MHYANLGRTGLKISRVGLGTMNYGPHVSEIDAHGQLDAALELGINFVDTADVYGDSEGKGATETNIGNWFRNGNRRREKTILGTKVYGDMDVESNDITMRRGLSAIKIRRSCEGSLRRLKTDHIDLYQMHHIARDTPWDEIWQAMEVLTQQGKIVYVGSSNFAGWHIATAQQELRRRNHLGLVSEQSKYSLLSRTVELEVLPSCEYYGVGLIPWSPLEGGLLGGVLRAVSNGRRGSERLRRQIEKMRSRLEEWEAFCDELGERPAEVALAWVLQNPVVTSAILGTRTVDQLTSSVRALEVRLDVASLRRLDEIFPGPATRRADSGTGSTVHHAPEAYAW
jgi:aryl-alcohol dehydrogenase-like predicted oxidoreductase